ncbi:hypothetical protein SUNI508_06060 [Seiridium unicorne]|uniref:Uncharacterized protein n=1 Tax=Seiridium unicorne TaxID=138068 RepID=A0ABR2V2X2_9PEZI
MYERLEQLWRHGRSGGSKPVSGSLDWGWQAASLD